MHWHYPGAEGPVLNVNPVDSASSTFVFLPRGVLHHDLLQKEVSSDCSGGNECFCRDWSHQITFVLSHVAGEVVQSVVVGISLHPGRGVPAWIGGGLPVTSGFPTLSVAIPTAIKPQEQNQLAHE